MFEQTVFWTVIIFSVSGYVASKAIDVLLIAKLSNRWQGNIPSVESIQRLQKEIENKDYNVTDTDLEIASYLRDIRLTHKRRKIIAALTGPLSWGMWIRSTLIRKDKFNSANPKV